MASLQLATSIEGESLEFNFDKWIVDNDITELKDIFIRLNMTTPSKLNTVSDEFGKLMRDPQLLAKAHLIPKLMDSLIKVPQIDNNDNDNNSNTTSEEEEALNKLNKYNDNILILIKQLNKSNDKRIKHFKELHFKIDAQFNEIYQKLENRRKEIQKTLIDIENEQKVQFTVKLEKLNEKHKKVENAIKSCYSLIKNTKIDKINKKKQIVSIVSETVNHKMPKCDTFNKINIKFDLKNELLEYINKFGEINPQNISNSSINKQNIFKYKSNLDKNGIIYYIGTKYIDSKSNKWINPCKYKNGLMNIDATPLEKGNILSQFIERKSIKKYKTKNIAHSFFIIDFSKIKIKIKPDCYTLRHSSPYGYYLRYWSFQGFDVNSNKWETIKDYINDHSLNKKNKIASFPLSCNQFYSKFRIIIDRKNSGDHFGLSGSDWTICCYGFELYGEVIFP